MYRLSPSLVNKFRMYMNDTEDYFLPTEKLVAEIVGGFVPTPEILLGQAYHQMIETIDHSTYLAIGNPGTDVLIQTIIEKESKQTYQFEYEACVEPVLDFLKAGAQKEVYGRHEIDTPEGKVSVATKADAAYGFIGGEWKTTQKSIDINKYADSLQWVLCCHVLGLKQMSYRILQLQKLKNDVAWRVKDWDFVDLIYQEHMMDDVIEVMAECIRFHRDQGLMDWLIPYEERPEGFEPQRR